MVVRRGAGVSQRDSSTETRFRRCLETPASGIPSFWHCWGEVAVMDTAVGRRAGLRKGLHYGGLSHSPIRCLQHSQDSKTLKTRTLCNQLQVINLSNIFFLAFQYLPEREREPLTIASQGPRRGLQVSLYHSYFYFF
ncbi:hypothetical protein Acr_14g0002530 [Actinidia rufa]|uniref:Uncharacterized protein n=1 Tax=Actinidia rufa TaxID=165716 RepID=A0A7J0FRS0_9ERIC|nr:hypothetical protein Acr_14g0002530 [Actinidia rufa]